MTEVTIRRDGATWQPNDGAREPMQRVGIVVLGMHRSGTSALTRALSLLGAALPKNLLGVTATNEAGHWEPARLIDLHDRMLAEAASRWDDWRAFDPAVLGPERLSFYREEIRRLVVEEYGDTAFPLLKEPRICRFVPLYEELLGELGIEPRYILTDRNPLAVIASLAKRNGMTEGFAGLVWLRHVLDAEKATRGKLRVFASYEAFLGDWRGVIGRIAERLGLTWPHALDEVADEIDAHLSRDLQHHTPTYADLHEDDHVFPWVKDAYAALQQLERAGDESGEALATLDRVRRELDAGTTVFGGVTFPELAAERRRLAAEQRASEQRNAQLAERNKVLTEKLAEVHESLAAERRRLAAEQRALEQRNARLAERNKSLTEKLAEVHENLATARSERARLQAALAAVHASTSWRMTGPMRAVMRSMSALPKALRVRKPEGRPGAANAAENRRAAAAGTAIHRLAYRELLIRALFHPKILTPYSAEDRYFVAFMESYGKHLAERYRDRPQSTQVSIVMPTFNRAHCIGDAIRSLVAQSYSNWQLIVVDDGSSDDTAAVVSSFDDARIEYVRLESRHGAAGARNIALDRARGDLIGYLDSDNAMEPEHLLILVHELLESPEFDLAYSGQRAFSLSGGEEKELYVHFAPFHRPSLENANYIDLGTIVHRRGLLESVGRFNADMRRLSDWEYLLRCTARRPAKAVPVISSRYYVDKASNRVTDVHSLGDGEARTDAWLRADPVSKVLTGISLPGFDQMYSLPYAAPEPVARRPVSIVVPSFEAEPYLRTCVEAIHGFRDGHEIELIVVDNASSAPVVAYLEDLEAKGRGKVLLSDVNRGFTSAVNRGIAAARPGNDIVILNNDAVVTRGWLSALQAVISDYPDVGLVAPSQIVLAGEPTLTIHQPQRRASRECDVNISAHHGNVIDPLFDASKGLMELAFAPFFCIYVPRATLDHVGMLDVENGPHYRSDRLYCDMVREVTGRSILYTQHAKVYHFVQRATKDLHDSDARLYEDMFVKNDWRAIAGAGDRVPGA